MGWRKNLFLILLTGQSFLIVAVRFT